jgi:hypothetical protein
MVRRKRLDQCLKLLVVMGRAFDSCATDALKATMELVVVVSVAFRY